MMIFADTHTHLYATEFDHDRREAVARALAAGVDQLFLPAIDSGHHEGMLKMVNDYPEHCFPMMGLHPTSVDGDYQAELEIVQGYLKAKQYNFRAIGEVGMDLYWDKTFRNEQETALEAQFDLAIAYDLPLVIHTRNSMDIVLEMLERRADGRLRGIFHCFGGNAAQAGRAINLGFLLGIGGVITYKNSGLQQVVEQTDMSHIVLETDAPWLPPVPHRGHRNEPAYLPLIAAKVAEIKHIPVSEVADITGRNAGRVFKTSI
jgi:TatD DNase family protein